MPMPTVHSSHAFHTHNFHVSQQTLHPAITDNQIPRTFTVPLIDDALLELQLWQHNDILRHQQSESQYPNAFVIKILFQDIIRRIFQSQEDGSIHSEDYVERSVECEQTLWEPYVGLETDAEFESTIRHIIRLNRFPCEDDDFASVAPGLSAFARSMTPLTCKNCGVTVRPFVVVVKSVKVEFYRTTRFLPVTKSSIEALEMVKFEGLGSMEQCMICLEELPVGIEVARMPCSHVYHGDCIVRWLETSHFCPLCRFAMPYN